ELFSFRDGSPGLLFAFRHRGQIVVRSKGQGDSPMRHGRLRLELRCPRKQTRGLVVVEAKDQRQPLVEKFLGQRRVSRYRVDMIPQPFQQFSRLRRLMFVMVVLGLRIRAGGKQQHNEFDLNTSHSCVSFRATTWQYEGQTLSRRTSLGTPKRRMRYRRDAASVVKGTSASD